MYKIALLATFRITDPDATFASLGKSLLEYSPVFKIIRDVDLEGNIISGIVLGQNLAKEFRRIETFFIEILPKEFASSYDASFTHRKKLKRESRTFAIEAKDV